MIKYNRSFGNFSEYGIKKVSPRMPFPEVIMDDQQRIWKSGGLVR